jgi:hypothetical protein
MKKVTKYLYDWRHVVVMRKKLTAKAFLDVCTYWNICTGIAGGLYYA